MKKAAVAKRRVQPKSKAKPAAKPKPKSKAKPAAKPKPKPRVAKTVARKNVPAPKLRARTNRESSKAPRPGSNGAVPHAMDVAATAYDTDVLTVLVRETENDDPREADAKIQKHLEDRKLGHFDAGRINQLRALKDAVVDEIQRTKDSSYFVGSHGLYANPEDFDHKRLALDFSERFPAISHEAIVGFIPFAIYCYYLR